MLSATPLWASNVLRPTGNACDFDLLPRPLKGRGAPNAFDLKETVWPHTHLPGRDPDGRNIVGWENHDRIQINTTGHGNTPMLSAKQ
jgi:hypothetical protein